MPVVCGFASATPASVRSRQSWTAPAPATAKLAHGLSRRPAGAGLGQSEPRRAARRAAWPLLEWSPPTDARKGQRHASARYEGVRGGSRDGCRARPSCSRSRARPAGGDDQQTRLLGEPLRPTTGGRPERKRGGEMARRSHRSETRSLATVSRRAQKLAPARKLLVCRDRRRSSENTRPLSRSGSLCSSLCRLGWSRHRSATSSVVRPIRCGGARCSGAWPV